MALEADMMGDLEAASKAETKITEKQVNEFVVRESQEAVHLLDTEIDDLQKRIIEDEYLSEEFAEL